MCQYAEKLEQIFEIFAFEIFKNKFYICSRVLLADMFLLVFLLCLGTYGFEFEFENKITKFSIFKQKYLHRLLIFLQFFDLLCLKPGFQ